MTDRDDTGSITDLLRDLADGDASAPHQLLPLVYEHLRWMARAQIAGERAECSVAPTSLIHEAYLRLLGGGTPVQCVDRAHFFNVAARAMRFVLVDRARALLAGRPRDHDGPRGARSMRGTPRRPASLPRDLVDQASHGDPDSIDALDRALCELERLDPRAAQVVIWRHYNGMTIEQVAMHLDCGVQTVNRDWRRARAWLADRLADDRDGETSA